MVELVEPGVLDAELGRGFSTTDQFIEGDAQDVSDLDESLVWAQHLFRHTMARLMLEGGADVRHIREILGHAELSTTALYTRVSIAQLVDVHRRTHPAAEPHTPAPARPDRQVDITSL